MAQARTRQNGLRSVRSKLGGPVTSSVIVVGALLILAGAMLQTGVWAGMLGIIGGLLITVAVVSRGLLWAYHQF
ncbi:hypothetical protein NDI76_17735 [Halogeometricum sp. S1BR25-6]|uniref:Uncharacterized protein n=1 Tax=Halogeometricum salsisoli TaxID=2950536 RepID=A0ABU2GK73_9EURY|nr:hypothetical protein [Halogeometricum sp. S1BR25-6]MDS0300594.1 hypothetical protein [Halogeometricum sp. S1BR25-6]